MKNTSDITTAAATLGRKGGKSTTEAKTTAARANGAKGGRPAEYEYVVHYTIWDGRDPIRTHDVYPSRQAAKRKADMVMAEQELGGGTHDVRITKRVLKK